MRSVAAAALAAFIAVSAVAEERATGPDVVAQLQARIATLEARVAALERAKPRPRPGGDAIDRVALLADRAMQRLVDMVRNLKRDLAS